MKTAPTDLENINFCVSLPTYGDNPSLNLSHAVLLSLFILRQNIGGEKTVLDGLQAEDKKSKAPITLIGKTIREWLELMGLNLEDHKKVNAYKVIHKMLLNNTPTQKEYRVLETMLQQTIRKLKQLKELEKN